MADEPVTPAGPNFEKLKGKLRELFELDKADLDFGIYRILRQRHDEIAAFLDHHLEKTVREALQGHETLQQSQVAEELAKVSESVKAAGLDPASSPKVQELRAKLTAGANLNATADEVYSHLLTFFSRYYDGGDFMGLARSTVHGREKYMIPYNGEEVKLVWANMDQYYIKTSELLRDYTFRIRRADLSAGQLGLDHLPEEAVIHFLLVEGDTEKDNIKPNGKTVRAFALDADKPFEPAGETTLNIRFRYREHATERDLQKKLNADTEKTLADNLPPIWKALLFAIDPTYQGKDKKDTRTMLQKHLRDYTARSQFDYFIHKDLGGFLRRELDFFIKNEVMYLDDIESNTAPKAEEYLSKIRALRRCAIPVIHMLEQLENFQKRLWLKKKFVVETRYCMTLDRVPETLYPDICASEAQWAEWERLYAISEIQPNLFDPQSTTRSPQFLKTNPSLMLDTRHFSRDFTLRLLASIGNLDETLDGVCLQSENFQALQLMQERYREQVKCVYIDPPYNTNASEIAYKNGYKDSSWISLINDRVKQARELLEKDGMQCFTIDDYEIEKSLMVLNDAFGSENHMATVPIRNNPQGRSTVSGFAINHEYAIFHRKTDDRKSVGRLKRSEQQIERYDENETDGRRYLWENFRKTGTDSARGDRPRQFYPIYVNKNGDVRISEMIWNEPEQAWTSIQKHLEDEGAVLPIDSSSHERCWKWGVDRAIKEISSIRAKKTPDGWEIYRKNYLNDEGKLPGTWWDDVRYSAGSHGTNLLTTLFGSERLFLFPKSVYAAQDCILVTAGDHLVLDFFAGSGTTGHAVINLNREDDGERKYILVEMGEYFDTVLVPRLKKVVYSTDWKEGKPQNRNTGISHAFKIVRLESYEDTLNNLVLNRTPEQKAALEKAGEKARSDYLLGYFLDVESAGSASLLDVKMFRDPFNYTLKIATASAGETKETAIDLVETFNWLIGLKVKHIDSQKGFLTVTGEKRAGGRTLILWRTLGDNPLADNEALEKYLDKLKVSPVDTEYDFIYVNGSHTLNDPHNKVHLIEEEFQRRMFESETFESLL
ncbi:MAG: site-specific DNA-methyltransferase [Nitrospinae bacterium]|nr:site-specific DNA-methyltransferase [Nitrospinota bacterium]